MEGAGEPTGRAEDDQPRVTSTADRRPCPHAPQGQREDGEADDRGRARVNSRGQHSSGSEDMGKFPEKTQNSNSETSTRKLKTL